MIEIKVEEYSNGFSVVAYEKETGVLIREVHRERLAALKALSKIAEVFLSRERMAILDAASKY